MNRNADILNELKELGSPLASLSAQMPFAVPDGYFTSLANDLQQSTGRYTLENGVATPLGAPPGYLEALPDTLTLSVMNTAVGGKGKAISFRPYWGLIGKTAAAAILVLGLSLGSYKYFNHRHTPDKIASRQLSKLDDQALINYVAQNVDEFDTETLAATLAVNADDGNEALSTLDATEIEQYLEDSGDTATTPVKTETY